MATTHAARVHDPHRTDTPHALPLLVLCPRPGNPAACSFARRTLPARRSAGARQRSSGQQLSVFSALEATRQAPSASTSHRVQDHAPLDPAAMEQRSLFD